MVRVLTEASMRNEEAPIRHVIVEGHVKVYRIPTYGL